MIIDGLYERMREEQQPQKLLATSIKDKSVEHHQTDKRCVKNYSTPKHEVCICKSNCTLNIHF